jgi:hypothetical protein
MGYIGDNPILLPSGTTIIKASAMKEGMKNSEVSTSTFTINDLAVAAPGFSPAAGTYAVDQSVTLSTSTSGATIYDTTNGAAPTTGSTPYSGPIAVRGDGTSVTVRAIAAKAGMTTSSIASAAYAIDYPGAAASTIVGHEQAKESVLRSIPSQYLNAARTNLRVSYQHTSHGTHVSYGLYGLQDYKAGDSTLFGISTSGASGKLAFGDNAIAGDEYCDLSTSDTAGWPSWLARNRAYLDDPSKSAGFNVVMWSWCSINGHNVSGYLSSMQTLINEYGPGGSKIGTGSGKTRTTPVTFVFMTGHAEQGDNIGAGKPKNQADLINAYCRERGYLCLDYFSIDSHDMSGNYYSDASDDAYSAVYGGNYNQAWQSAHARGTDWYYDKSGPGGSAAYGEHLSQYITANRKAYAMWYILARISGWDGISTD